MKNRSESKPIDRADFLSRHHFTAEEYDRTCLDWAVLEDICARHVAMISELQKTASYITQRLQEVPDVHSLKVRVKDPEHLIAKIIRKRLDSSEFCVDAETYRKHVTDLIGIRALHLFKDQWRPIHDFVIETWELHEDPIAYYRAGDPEPLLASFREAKCKVTEHKFGYRSIHYVIKSQPDKQLHLVELQVRTIFEEGWSEIDHQVQYPRLSTDTYLADFLTIFNRLAGSADEMGTFIKALSQYVCEQRGKLAERDRQIAEQGKRLKETVSALKISIEQKKELESQVDSLRKSSQQRGFPPVFPSADAILGSRPGLLAAIDPILGAMSEKTCTKCGKKYEERGLASIFSPGLCPECSPH